MVKRLKSWTIIFKKDNHMRNMIRMSSNFFTSDVTKFIAKICKGWCKSKNITSKIIAPAVK